MKKDVLLSHQGQTDADKAEELIDLYIPKSDGFGSTAVSGAGYSIDRDLGRAEGRWEAEMEPGKIWNQGPTPRDQLKGKSQI